MWHYVAPVPVEKTKFGGTYGKQKLQSSTRPFFTHFNLPFLTGVRHQPEHPVALSIFWAALDPPVLWDPLGQFLMTVQKVKKTYNCFARSPFIARLSHELVHAKYAIYFHLQQFKV